jgi:Zn-dependent protease with chaperone function
MTPFLASVTALFTAVILVSATISKHAKTANRPPPDRWFHMYVWISYRLAVVWLSLWAICQYFHGADLIANAFGVGSPAGQFSIVAAMIASGVVVNLICASIEAPRYSDVRMLPVEPGEIVRLGLMTDVCVASVALGIASLESFTSLGPVLLIVPLIVTFLVARNQRAAIGIRPFALSRGELRDAVFGLAARGNVSVRNLYVLPSTKWRIVNAFAARGSNVMLSQALIEALSRREVDALVAHELTHVKERHIQKIGMWIMSVLIPVVIATTFYSTLSNAGSPLLGIQAAVVLFLVISPQVRRRYEWRADAGAAALTGDPEAVITGLIRITRLNCLPLEFARPWAWLITHPSTLRRVKAIAKGSAITPERLNELIASAVEDTIATRYEIEPPAEMTARLFTTEYKARAGWALLGTSVVVFAVLPVAASHLAPGIYNLRESMLVYAIAAVLTAIIEWLAVVWLVGSQNRRLGSRLRAKFDTQHRIPRDANATFVALSPSAAVRIYENRYEWDVGFVWLNSGRLFYEGELSRFEISPDAVSSIALERGALGLPASMRVVVTFQTATGPRFAAIRPLAIPPSGRAGVVWSRLRRACANGGAALRMQSSSSRIVLSRTNTRSRRNRCGR